MTRAEWGQVLVALIPALIVAAFTAVITVRLALSRFYTERWWERKASTYSELLAALHAIVRYGEEFLSAYGEGRHVLPELRQELAEQSQQGSSRLAREADVGAFIVSEKAAEMLEACRRQLWSDDPNDDMHETISKQTSAARECLKALTAEAKRDLRVK